MVGLLWERLTCRSWGESIHGLLLSGQSTCGSAQSRLMKQFFQCYLASVSPRAPTGWIGPTQSGHWAHPAGPGHQDSESPARTGIPSDTLWCSCCQYPEPIRGQRPDLSVRDLAGRHLGAALATASPSRSLIPLDGVSPSPGVGRTEQILFGPV